MFIELLLTVIFLILLWALVRSPRPQDFPPGPTGYPLIGSAPKIMKLGKTISSALASLSETYGPVVGIQLGTRWAIAVNGPEEVKEVLTSDAFAGRPKFIKSFTEKKLGIMFVDGEFWRVQRRFTMRHLRDWGFGKTSLESVIHDEVEECMSQMNKKLKNTSDAVIPVHDLFNVSVVNILWTVMAGKRHSHEDANFIDMLNKINALFRSGTPLGSFVARFPILKYLPYIGETRRRQERAQREMVKFLEESVREHQRTRDPTEPRDFIDTYLQALEDSPDGVPPDSSFTTDQLISVCTDLFGAGAESTANSIAFSLLYMILYPDVQDKVREEIHRILGTDRLVSYNDRSRLPYCEAVLAELQRISSIAPFTPPHSTLEDTKLGGYKIPKGTFVLVNLWCLHNDKKIWGDPDKFRPERFVNSEGFIKDDNLIPFGAGKRACPGESLARMNVFIFFVTLMQNYKFEVDKSMAEPSVVPLSGFTQAPQPFNAKIVKLT